MRKDKFKQVCHLIAGFAVITRAYQSFEQGEFKECAMYILLGSLFLVISGIEEWIVKRAPRFESLFFLQKVLLFYTYRFSMNSEKALSTLILALQQSFFYWGFIFYFFQKRNIAISIGEVREKKMILPIRDTNFIMKDDAKCILSLFLILFFCNQMNVL